MSISENISSKKEDTITSQIPDDENKKEFVIRTTNGGLFSNSNNDMTEVLPNLYMGAIDPALDQDLLENFKIKHVLTLGLLNVPNFEGISYTHLRLLDHARFNILPHLETANSVIESARNADETIYVHCQAGVSRSSTVVIAYLMKINKWTYQQAHDFLKKLRPIIEPNQGFVKQLLKYEANILNQT